MRDLIDPLVLLLALVGYILILLFAPPVSAQDRRLSPQEALLAFEVARIAMNESMGNEADLAMIWQIVEARAPGVPGRRGWLRHHSQCVSGLRSQRGPGPCRWTRELTPRGSRPPSFRDCREVQPCDGTWPRVRRRWRATLARSLAHARGETLPIVCPVDPLTWDGRRWLDDARGRGFEELGCKGTLNEGFVRRRTRARRARPRRGQTPRS